MNNYQRSVLKIILEVLIIFIAGSLAIFFLLRSTDKITSNIRDKKLLFETSKNRPDLITKLENDYVMISPYADKIKNIIPRENELNNLTIRLEGLSRNYQIISTFQFLDQSKKITDNLTANSFKIIANGNLKNITSYLKELEALPFFFDIKNVNILEKGDASNLSIYGNIYLNDN